MKYIILIVFYPRKRRKARVSSREQRYPTRFFEIEREIQRIDRPKV